MTIQEKAQAALAARDAHDPRFNVLVMMLSMVRGIPDATVISNIEKLARGESC